MSRAPIMLPHHQFHQFRHRHGLRKTSTSYASALPPLPVVMPLAAIRNPYLYGVGTPSTFIPSTSLLSRTPASTMVTAATTATATSAARILELEKQLEREQQMEMELQLERQLHSERRLRLEREIQLERQLRVEQEARLNPSSRSPSPSVSSSSSSSTPPATPPATATPNPCHSSALTETATPARALAPSRQLYPPSTGVAAANTRTINSTRLSHSNMRMVMGTALPQATIPRPLPPVTLQEPFKKPTRYQEPKQTRSPKKKVKQVYLHSSASSVVAPTASTTSSNTMQKGVKRTRQEVEHRDDPEDKVQRSDSPQRQVQERKNVAGANDGLEPKASKKARTTDDSKTKKPSPRFEGEWILPESFQPHETSVICGRGKKCYTSIGNLKLRSLVIQRLSQYSQSNKENDRKAKSEIVSEIIEQVKDSCPDRTGAFIKQQSKDGTGEKRWYEVSQAVARERVSSIFRDFLHPAYRSSTGSRVTRRRQERFDRLDLETS